MAGISLVSRVRTAAGPRRNDSKKTRQKQQEDNSEGDICYLENICGAQTNLNVPAIKDELNIDSGKHVRVLAMF